MTREPLMLLAAVSLVATRRRFSLTELTHRLIALHALILLWGAHHSYPRVPLGDWLQDVLDLAHNPYDRIGGRLVHHRVVRG